MLQRNKYYKSVNKTHKHSGHCISVIQGRAVILTLAKAFQSSEEQNVISFHTYFVSNIAVTDYSIPSWGRKFFSLPSCPEHL
jgi:hypothetical protein